MLETFCNESFPATRQLEPHFDGGPAHAVGAGRLEAGSKDPKMALKRQFYHPEEKESNRAEGISSSGT